MQVAHDSFKAGRHPIGDDICILSLGVAVGIAAALVDILFLIRQNPLFQHERDEIGLSLGRNVLGRFPVQLIGLSEPLKNQVTPDIHGVDSITLKGEGNAVNQVDISHGSTSLRPWYLKA